MHRRTTLIILLGIALFAVPSSGHAESGDVSIAKDSSGIEGEFAASQLKKGQAIKPKGRLKGTVEYKMELGNGKGDSEGQAQNIQSGAPAENIQSADHPENWVESGRNSRGVIRTGPMGWPIVSNGHINLKLIEGSKLPPTIIGNPIITYPNDEIYGNDVIHGEPPYYMFDKNYSKPSELIWGQAPPKNIKRQPEIKSEEIKPPAGKTSATTGDAQANKSDVWWSEPNTSEPAK